ncbi:2-iminobutanoate/2-iminopropanoate deaminase-like isoform X2 [Macrotis lagotis]|uniref:2-iminobutanoate/2-iminopropanoate deaminase-like isoform X2 n=1 Tax=Macrotis lagotis TaxID=92651 RepID=UPI003D69E763
MPSETLPLETRKNPTPITSKQKVDTSERELKKHCHDFLNEKSTQHRKGATSHRPLQALVNVGEILKAGGCDFSNVVKSTVLLADINDFNLFNEVYKQFFKGSFPARAAYQVAALPLGAHMEIEVIAVQGPLTCV